MVSQNRFFNSYIVLALASLFIVASAEPAPLVIPPSQYWDGNDGPWSSFPMQVGTPNTNETRVLVSTAIPSQWIVLSEACKSTDTNCAATRGKNLFNPNASSTWENEGIYNLLFEENLNYSGNGLYGFDTVSLGFANNNASVTMQNQTIAGIVQDDFWMGYIGINPQPTNFTDLSNPIPSLFKNMQTQGKIPSLTYSYTAGAPYQLKGVYGSLIFGGMDTSRFQPNSVTFNFGPDISRDLLVGVQSFYSTQSNGKQRTFLSEGVFAYVDSTVPYIVMPDEACDEIEQAFDLTMDNKTGLYLLTEAQHTTLASQDLNFTFVLGNSLNGGASVSISLPYEAFDLTYSGPGVSSSSKYFPLKRGNDSTYTLGRTFLQEAYLTSDYERGNFSISQCVWDEDAKSSIQAIHSTNWTAPPSEGSSGSPNAKSNSSLTTGAIVGIVVAAVIFIAVIATLAVLRHFRRWPFHKRPHPGLPELDANGNPIGPMAINHSADIKASVLGGAVEADSKDDLHHAHGYYGSELQGSHGDLNKPELVGSSGHLREKNELPGSDAYRTRGTNELYGSDAAREVEGSSAIMELAGSPVGAEYLRKPARSRDHSPSASSGVLSPPSPHSGSGGKERSPISPLARNLGSSPLRQSRSSSAGVSPAARSPVTPTSPNFSRQPSQNQHRGRGLGIRPGRDPDTASGDIGMAR